MGWRLLWRLFGAGLFCCVLAVGRVLWVVDRADLFVHLGGTVMFGMWLMLDSSGRR